ncbi:DUF58 domain-containing protein [Deinococcus maricopensis]|uniref:DUF58 domain-containing protein n=1 Tax=Deinococcus maricopensis (strain DSM 21211 / LMG 22137 / NRRL B-23946 / LB-34) TaxID=709986 RepID=E8UA78_DEIML|nr:DUF58 domain-containing protein [Deinococcus maricopensis]ADV67967.1 protein of unknown function DUF58 [Deinococcus maricopensis DSM 21211]
MALLAWVAALLALVALLRVLYARPPQVQLTRTYPPAAFEGDRVPLTVTIRVHARLPTRVLIEDPTPRTVVPDAQLTLGGLVFGRLALTHAATLTPQRRGVHAWSGSTLAWADPLGLFWHRAPLTVPDALEVYPGTHGLVLPDLLRPLLSEGSLARTVGLDDPISLRGARPYVPGDPPARLHWRLTARMGTPMVREVERTAASRVTVHVDARGTDEYVEAAARLAASLTREALELQVPVVVSDAEGRSLGGRTPEALRSALSRLARLHAQPDAPARIPEPEPGGNLIVITQRAGAAFLASALAARAYARRVVVIVLPEGFYLEPGEVGRPIRFAPPDAVRDLERQAGVLEEAGVLLYVLRGNSSVLRLGA